MSQAPRYRADDVRAVRRQRQRGIILSRVAAASQPVQNQPSLRSLSSIVATPPSAPTYHRPSQHEAMEARSSSSPSANEHQYSHAIPAPARDEALQRNQDALSQSQHMESHQSILHGYHTDIDRRQPYNASPPSEPDARAVVHPASHLARSAIAPARPSPYSLQVPADRHPARSSPSPETRDFLPTPPSSRMPCSPRSSYHVAVNDMSEGSVTKPSFHSSQPLVSYSSCPPRDPRLLAYPHRRIQPESHEEALAPESDYEKEQGRHTSCQLTTAEPENMHVEEDETMEEKRESEEEQRYFEQPHRQQGHEFSQYSSSSSSQPPAPLSPHAATHHHRSHTTCSASHPVHPPRHDQPLPSFIPLNTSSSSSFSTPSPLPHFFDKDFRYFSHPSRPLPTPPPVPPPQPAHALPHSPSRSPSPALPSSSHHSLPSRSLTPVPIPTQDMTFPASSSSSRRSPPSRSLTPTIIPIQEDSACFRAMSVSPHFQPSLDDDMVPEYSDHAGTGSSRQANSGNSNMQGYQLMNQGEECAQLEEEEQRHEYHHHRPRTQPQQRPAPYPPLSYSPHSTSSTPPTRSSYADESTSYAQNGYPSDPRLRARREYAPLLVAPSTVQSRGAQPSVSSVPYGDARLAHRSGRSSVLTSNDHVREHAESARIPPPLQHSLSPLSPPSSPQSLRPHMPLQTSRHHAHVSSQDMLSAPRAASAATPASPYPPSYARSHSSCSFSSSSSSSFSRTVTVDQESNASSAADHHERYHHETRTAHSERQERQDARSNRQMRDPLYAIAEQPGEEEGRGGRAEQDVNMEVSMEGCGVEQREVQQAEEAKAGDDPGEDIIIKMTVATILLERLSKKSKRKHYELREVAACSLQDPSFTFKAAVQQQCSLAELQDECNRYGGKDTPLVDTHLGAASRHSGLDFYNRIPNAEPLDRALGRLMSMLFNSGRHKDRKSVRFWARDSAAEREILQPYGIKVLEMNEWTEKGRPVIPTWETIVGMGYRAQLQLQPRPQYYYYEQCPAHRSTAEYKQCKGHCALEEVMAFRWFIIEKLGKRTLKDRLIVFPAVLVA